MRWLALIGTLGLLSCAGGDKVVQIKQHHLREVDTKPNEVDPVRAEILKRMHGAVTAEEQLSRLGHYYTVRWKGPEGRESELVRIVFEYRQAATASQVRKMVAELPASKKGSVEFQVIGDAYQRGGRVLAWKLSFFRSGELVETHHSFLWN